MIRAPLEQAFETCQKNKSDWMSSKSALARAEMALKEYELISTRYEPDAVQALRDDIDLKKWAVNQSAGRYIRSHEAVQRISMRRQLHAFMQVSGDGLAAALAPELMLLRELPEIVRERALDRAAASVREALSVHLASGRDIHYAQDDRDILTTIGFRPDRASRDDSRAKYTSEQSQIFMCRQAAQTCKKSA
ncbi:TPA: phage polarity suppression protein [Citrobacter freundii]|uniref:phage polarity suppression protein n=1 Tax=Citrobacter freundii TaxID=546 RepID=UPI001A2A62BD|nr:phage polarity suppression protein [Citrobacter freundii]HCB2475518.1 phage polarity suppression protein [Citrobacter freundii]HDQ2971405.1 phage polarity suppression protein [Citrobacter freundii]HEG1965049.1 phage polarity suppression protein [Citrobacter freundii]